jgi:hypothetical protein
MRVSVVAPSDAYTLESDYTNGRLTLVAPRHATRKEQAQEHQRKKRMSQIEERRRRSTLAKGPFGVDPPADPEAAG